VRSLQVKFSALVITLLALACGAFGWVATHHERGALEAEVAERGRTLVAGLARASAGPLEALGRGERDAADALQRLLEQTSAWDGVAAVRISGADGAVLAALEPSEPPAGQLELSAPIRGPGGKLGEARLGMDLRGLVDPVLRGSARRLGAVGVAVLGLGVGAGLAFVALLVGPLRRLREGVERLSAGDVTVRVPPTSGDEVGELTRAFNEMGDSLLQKQRIQNAFGRYVDDYVLNQLLEGPVDGQQLGIEREVTLLFADIRSFTRLSEGMKAHDVVTLLNEVFQLVSDHILEQGGTIDKFIGDSVMAYFGAPVPHADHPQRAVSAAMALIAAIEARNRGARELDPASPSLVPVEIGIGVHTGKVVVGNIGSDRRTDFTAVGDAVNVAHRLEKLARPGQVLVSEVVQRRVRDAFRLHFEGERQLSGREEPVHVYAVERSGAPARKPEPH
jgi:class 3 adenylate cyclase